jgi:hypothetical protein
MTTRIVTTFAATAIAALLAGCCSPFFPPPVAGGPPVIIKHPVSRIKERGTHVDFTVIATNIGPALTYQWCRNASNILDATNKTYSIEGVQVTNVASYTCKVTAGTNGSVTSFPGHLSVYYTYQTNSVVGTLVAPIGAFSSSSGVTIDGQVFDRISSNYFYFYGPNAYPQVGDFQNTTYMPRLTVDTYSTDNNTVDTGIQAQQWFGPYYRKYPNNDGVPVFSTAQPDLSKFASILLSTKVDPNKACYIVTVYYVNSTLGSNTTITFNWLYH